MCKFSYKLYFYIILILKNFTILKKSQNYIEKYKKLILNIKYKIIQLIIS